MVAYSSILPPNSLGELLRPLGSLSDVEFAAILRAVSGPRSFSLKKDELENLRNRLPPEAAKNITFLISALSFVYAHVVRLTESQMAYRDAISGIVDELAGDARWQDKDKVRVTDRFAALLDPKVHAGLQKVQRLQSGFLPNAVGFSTLVDLRPDFGTGAELQLTGYVPVIQFRIRTDAESPAEQRIIFQVNESSLAELKKAVERAEMKLSMLRQQSAVASEIVKQS
jgi:hypothetical protein